MCSSVRMASQKNISLKHTICSWFFQEHFHYWWHPPPAFMYCVFFLHVLSPCGRGKLPTYMFFAPKPKSRNSWVSVFISTWHDPVLSCHGTLRRTSPLKCHHMDNPLIGWLSYHFHSSPNHILNLPQYHVKKKPGGIQRLQYEKKIETTWGNRQGLDSKRLSRCLHSDLHSFLPSADAVASALVVDIPLGWVRKTGSSWKLSCLF